MMKQHTERWTDVSRCIKQAYEERFIIWSPQMDLNAKNTKKCAIKYYREPCKYIYDL